MKHLKRYNSLIFESVTKDIGDNDIEEKIKRISDYIHRFPQEKDRMLSELENIKRGLRGKEWVGETEYYDPYQVWEYHYQGFTRENMEKLISGVNAKLGTGEEMKTEVNKIIEIAKEFLQKYPTSKDFLLQSVTHEFQRL
jgi:hypothetical protein